MLALTLMSSTALTLDAAAFIIPHPAKATTGGEDAFFMLSRCRVFGVFDGVGGWQSEGVDPGLFSRAFARCTADAIEEEAGGSDGDDQSAGGGGTVDLKRAMTTGLSRVNEIGTSTACLVYIGSDGKLQVSRRRCKLARRLLLWQFGHFSLSIRASVAPTLPRDDPQAFNVGDSGFRLLRPSQRGLAVEKRSREQQHYFNCPYQLGTRSRDRPSDGDAYSASVRADDLVVLMTDGVSDNLSDEDICEALRSPLAAGEEAAALAQALASLARTASQQPLGETPFAVSARKQGFSFPGGKPDDVTVLCVRVLDAGVAVGGQAVDVVPGEGERGPPSDPGWGAMRGGLGLMSKL
jgi:protein phosphatase PTC7